MTLSKICSLKNKLALVDMIKFNNNNNTFSIFFLPINFSRKRTLYFPPPPQIPHYQHPSLLHLCLTPPRLPLPNLSYKNEIPHLPHEPPCLPFTLFQPFYLHFLMIVQLFQSI